MFLGIPVLENSGQHPCLTRTPAPSRWTAGAAPWYHFRHDWDEADRKRSTSVRGGVMNKSGNSSQPISLPKGGGALHGLGEKFAPDLHTGTGNFTVPLALPTGRNGFQPQLSLVYSTGNGNGPFGLGWSLSIPGVTRKTSKGIPVYDDSNDVFILSGAEDLVAIPGGPSGATRYRPRTEGLFARIEHNRDARNDYWEARSKDGLIST